MPDFDLSSAKAAGQFDLATANPTDHSGIVDKSLEQSPFPISDAKYTVHPDAGMGVPGDDKPLDLPWSDDEKSMAAKGIDITTGVPYKLRNSMSFLTGKATDEDYKNAINSYYGKDVGVRKMDNGELAYVSPDTNRLTLVNGKYGSLPTAGSIMNAIGTTVGGAVGGAMGAPGGIAGVALGGVGGAIAGQTAVDVGKSFVAKAVGFYPKDRTSQQDFKGYNEDIGQAALGEAVGQGLFGAYQGAKWFTRGFMPFKKEQIQSLLAETQDSQQALDNFYDLTGRRIMASGPEMAPRRGEMMDIFRTSYGTSGPIKETEQNRVNDNLFTIKAALDDVTGAQKPTPDYQFGSSGEQIQFALAQKKNQALAAESAQESMSAAAAQRTAEGLPAWSPEASNARLKEILDLADSQAKGKMDSAYNNLNTILGVKNPGVTTPVASVGATSGPSDRFLQPQTPTQLVPFSPVAKIKLQNFLKEAEDNAVGIAQGGGAVDTDIGRAMGAAIPEGLKRAPAEDESAPLGFKLNLDTPADLYKLIQFVQNTRSGVRQAMASGKGSLAPQDHDLATMGDIIAGSVGDYFKRSGDPKVMNAWEEAQQAAIDYHQEFRTKIMNEIIKKQDGFPAPTYDQAVGKLLYASGKNAPTQEGIRQLASITKGDPQAQEDIRGMIWASYNNSYLPKDGIPTRATFQKFKDDFEGPIKEFFTQDEQDKMGTLTDLTNQVISSQAKLKNIKAQWDNQGFGKDLGRLNSTTLSNSVFSNSIGPGKMQRLTQWIGESGQPELLSQLRADTAQKFSQMATDANGVIVPSKFDQIIQKYGDKLSQVMDPQWMYAVKTINQAAKVPLSGATLQEIPGSEPKSVLTQVVRWLVAPPLSGEGRAYTALLLARQKASDRIVYNTLSSPEGLKNFLAVKDKQITDQAIVGALGELGGQTLQMANGK